MAVLAPEIVRGIFGEQWTQSIPVMQVLAVVGVIRLVVQFFGPIFIAMGKPAWDLWLALVNTAVRILGFLIAVQWGIVAVAISIVLLSIPFVVVRFILLNRLIKIDIGMYFRQYTSSALATFIMSIAIAVTRYYLNDLVSIQTALAVYIAIGVVSYIVSISIISPDLIRQILDLVNPKETANLELK